MYIFTIEPSDIISLDKGNITITMNDDGFNLFNIDIKDWTKKVDNTTKTNIIIVNGQMAMSLENYNYILDHKYKIKWGVKYTSD
jgi:hypothetical protein